MECWRELRIGEGVSLLFPIEDAIDEEPRQWLVIGLTEAWRGKAGAESHPLRRDDLAIRERGASAYVIDL